MNPVAVVLRAVQLARAAGLVVTFEPGWETRGNGLASRWVGGVDHHTASPSSLTNPFPTRWVLRDGRSNLSGPLCNSAGPADGSIHIVAAQAANHAGASGGRSMGPLPVTTLFNPLVWGHEIDYAGTVPMTHGQYVASAIWFRCLLVALHEAGQIPAVDPERIRMHAETSVTGKWDPGYALNRTIDAAQFRRDVMTMQGDDMSLTAEEHGWLAGLNTAIGWTFANKLGVAGQVMGRTEGKVDTALAKLAGIEAAVTAIANDPDITPDQLGTQVNAAVAEHMPSAAEVAEAQRPYIDAMVTQFGDVVREKLGEDNAGLANEIVDELTVRLTGGGSETAGK
jgi:hypothetical protein